MHLFMTCPGVILFQDASEEVYTAALKASAYWSTRIASTGCILAASRAG